MKKWIKLLQNCTFVQLLYLWISIGVGFAVIYYILNFSSQGSLLYLNQPLGYSFLDFLTIVYFSFITLTSTGYGDVIPLGISKILSIVEIFCGLVVFGFLISKLITARQQKIIEEIYAISFEEKVNRLRSELYAYRANVSRIIDRINTTKFVKKSNITDLEANVESLSKGIGRIKRFFVSEEKKSITKVDDLTINLLLNSLSLSISKTIDLTKLLNKRRYGWKRQTVAKYILSCIKSIKEIQELYEKKKLKEELKSLLKSIDDSSKQLGSLVNKKF